MARIGIPLTDIMLYGRWSSLSSFKLYIAKGDVLLTRLRQNVSEEQWHIINVNPRAGEQASMCGWTYARMIGLCARPQVQNPMTSETAPAPPSVPAAPSDAVSREIRELKAQMEQMQQQMERAQAQQQTQQTQQIQRMIENIHLESVAAGGAAAATPPAGCCALQ